MIEGPFSTITIRPAASADASILGRLGALLVTLHHDFDPTRFIAPTQRTPDLYAAFLDTQRQREDAIVLVAESEGMVAGYTYATLDGNDFMALRGPAGVLHDLIVDPAHRRQGIGRLLAEAARAELTSKGAPRLVLSTAAKNEAARRLFEALGFRATMIEMTVDMEPAKIIT
ncbi:GNAT family N-acetyltransferase [Sphingomonas phyllosphaerae]|uniref:GNAT family N-acetyltransferase n=1 Tax=Sphingomonas phyllosphaerae TaxID=257003 RepID=UPI00048A81B4|nr:GNAT family N-acetyltransferase [Sphingomonas phyllosphaerae]